MPRTSSDRPDAHYDSITRAWRHLMGESFHYGHFESTTQKLDEATHALTQLMTRHARLTAEHRVLDVGCGIGQPAMHLARKVGCHVTGISTSEVGISMARAQSSQHSLEGRVTFMVQDGMCNGFADRVFDRVWVMESSHLMPDKAALISDSARVLKPEGRMVLCDIIMHRDLDLREVLARASSFDLLRKVFGRAKMVTLSAYSELCHDAGLRVDHLDDISSRTAPTFDHWKANAGKHREEVVALVGETYWSDFVQACDDLKNLWEEGTLGYGLIAAEKLR